MSKSLNARCIRRWKVKFKSVCDSKVNPLLAQKRPARVYPRSGAYHRLQHGREHG